MSHNSVPEAEMALDSSSLNELGGKLPEVTGERASTEQSSWQHLLKDLNEEDHCAGELMEQIWAVATDYPDIAALLEQISKEEENIDKGSRLSGEAPVTRLHYWPGWSL